MYRPNTNRKTFPADYDPDDCVWAPIPCALVPLLAGKVSELERKAEWLTESDWFQGYQAIVRWEAELMSCSQSLNDKLDRILASMGYSAGLETDDPDYDPTDTQLAALERLRSGLSSGDTSLDDIMSHIDQVETYLRGIADLIGGHSLPPIDQP